VGSETGPLDYGRSLDGLQAVGKRIRNERGRLVGGPALPTRCVVGYGSVYALMSGPAAEKWVNETRYSFPPTE